MIGKKIAHYKILEKLGEGGMGEVYLAEDKNLKRKVAIKVLPPELAADENRLERFQREAEAVAALDHPNIVTIYSVEEFEGTRFLTMSYVEGDSLDRLISGSGIDLDRLFSIAVPLADALAAAHDKGITHRDLKPANIMVTPEGRVKVLDFGLAKLQEGAVVATDEDEPTRALTQEGLVVGTIPYMSPEQVEGKVVDHRTDIFTFGVLLYEMATGERPFGGQSSAQVISSILRDNPASVAERKAELPFHLGRIVRHCLEKDPRRRFQSALDLRNELEALREEVASGEMRPASSAVIPAAEPTKGRPRWLLPAIGAAAVVVLALGWLIWGRGEQEPAPGREASAPQTVEGAKPSVAVLYFDNLTGDQELDWLRTGLTDMLVTDLSQLSDIRVVGTDRIYEILKGLNRLDDPITSAAVVRQVAEQAGVETVLLGSFAKSGDTLRISIKVQEAATGDILATDRVEGPGGDNLFAMVDDLSSGVRERFQIPDSSPVGDDNPLMNVTTSSLEAYRFYAEGVNLENKVQTEEAEALLEKAVELDPGFAMALRKLSAIAGNQGRLADNREYARRALENADRLPLRERYLVEAQYYQSRPATIGRTLEAYKKLLDIEPENTAARNNLGLWYSNLDRHAEAVPILEEAVLRGASFQGTYWNLATGYANMGRVVEAEEAFQRLLRKEPASAVAVWGSGWLELGWGDPRQALGFYKKAETLLPGNPQILAGQAEAQVLLEDWGAARSLAQRLADRDDPVGSRMGLETLAWLELYHGRSAAALAINTQRVEGYAEADGVRADMKADHGEWLLAQGETDRALAVLREALAEAREEWAEFEVLQRMADAQMAAGDLALAKKTAGELREKLLLVPSDAILRTYHLVAGELALVAGNHAEAISELEKAEAMLPPAPAYLSQATDIRYALAYAYSASGDGERAAAKLQELVGSGRARMERPIRYVRSFYLLGQLAEEEGDGDRARSNYQRFLDHWADGDLDRDQVAHAQAYLQIR